MHGVHPILPTPFLEDGTLDLASLKKLIDFQADVGVQGVAILGFLGEAHKLSAAERQTVTETVIEQAAGRLEVSVGVRAFGAAGAIEQAQAAESLGAHAVFVAPIGVQNDNALEGFYRQVADAISIPLLLHDYPASFGTKLSTQLIARLVNDVPGITGIKAEDPPVLQKLTTLMEQTGGQIESFGGLGGEYFLEELRRGARGIMTGFAYPEILLAIYEHHAAGRSEAAAAVFDKYASLIRYEFQPGVGLAFRKHIYVKRGIFATTFVRPPGVGLDATTQDELDELVARMGLAYASTPEEVG